VPLAINAALAQNHSKNSKPHGIVGTVPPQFNPDVDAYQHIDILRLVVFYNDDFGILPGDQLPEREAQDKELVDGNISYDKKWGF